MNVVPKSPNPTAPTGSSPSTAADARARAIAKLTAPAPSNEQPVPNASSISPEELGALGKKAADLDTTESPDETQAASEAPKEEAKPKEDPLSSQYATLARKERALRAQIQQFKAEQEKFKAEQSSYKAPETDLSKYVDRERLKADPLAVFAEAGLSYDEIVEQVLSRSQIQTDPRVNAQLAKMEAEIKAAREEAKALRDAQETSQKQSYQQAVAQIKSEVSKAAFTDPSYEMIKATNSINDVVELIEETFKSDGTLLTTEEAMQMVEDHLLEEAIKLSKVKKLQQRLAAPAAPQKQANKNEQPQPTQKTLTNSMSVPKPMSARDRAIAAMQGKLTK